MVADRPDPSPLSDTLPVGTRIRDQVIEAFLRSLPEGRLYRVKHAQTGAEAMLQEYLPEACARRVGQGIALIPGRGPEFRAGMQRFLLRAQQLKSLSHAALPALSDLMPSHGTAFAVMPLMNVRTLAEVVEAEGGRLPLAQIWPWLNTCCDLAQWLHDQGRIHGALEPGSIWVLDEQRLLLPPPELEEGYRPPSPWVALEQTVLASSGTPRGPWTDVYGIGALASFMLTGQGPKSAARRTVAPVRSGANGNGHGGGAPTVWADSRSGGLDPIPGVLKAAIRVSLMPNPRERPQDIGQFKAMLGLAEQLSVSPGGDPRDTIPDPLHGEAARDSVPPWLATAAGTVQGGPPKRQVSVVWKETSPPAVTPPTPARTDAAWQPRPDERAPDSVPVEGLDSLPPGLAARHENLRNQRRHHWATFAVVASLVTVVGLWTWWRALPSPGQELATRPPASVDGQASFEGLVRESPTAAGLPASSGAMPAALPGAVIGSGAGMGAATAVTAGATASPSVDPPRASALPTPSPDSPVPADRGSTASTRSTLGDAGAATAAAGTATPSVPAAAPVPNATAAAGVQPRPARSASAATARTEAPSGSGSTGAQSAAARQRCSQALVEQSLGVATAAANVDKYCR